VLLIDDILTPPDEMSIAKKYVAAYLREMPAGTEVAVFAVSHNKGFWMLQDFTTDGAQAAASVEAMDVEWLRNPVNLDPKAVMRAIAAHAARIQGRKNLIWFASHPPVQPKPCGGFDTDQSVRDFFQPLMAAHFAVYPVAAEGLKTGAPSLVPRTPDQPPTPSLGASMQGFALSHSCDTLGMEMEAEATGGKALYNSNDFKGMVANAVEDGSHVYTLTYATPPMAMDTRFHSVSVKVDRPGVALAYRNGFNAETMVTETAPAAGPKLMQASMERGAPPVNQILFDVKVQPATETVKKNAAKGKSVTLTRYGFVFTVPTKQIAFTDGPDGVYRGAMEFDVVAFGADGRQVTMLSQTLNMPLTPDAYADFVQKPLEFRQQIDLPVGQMNVRAGIFDKMSNKVGTLEIPLTVAKPGPVVAGK
jgi:VWFA-related protein